MDEKVRCYFVEKTCTLGYGTHQLRLATKLLRHSNRVTSENKRIHTPSSLPSIQSWGVCCFLQVFRIAAQHCMKGMGEGKLYFLLLKLVKSKRSPLGQSVSTNFVADCSLHQALHSNNWKQIIQIEHNRVKKKQLAEGNQLALSRHGRGFELGTTENKYSKMVRTGLEHLGDSDFLFDTLTTRPSSTGSPFVQVSGEECSLFTKFFP